MPRASLSAHIYPRNNLPCEINHFTAGFSYCGPYQHTCPRHTRVDARLRLLCVAVCCVFRQLCSAFASIDLKEKIHKKYYSCRPHNGVSSFYSCQSTLNPIFKTLAFMLSLNKTHRTPWYMLRIHKTVPASHIPTYCTDVTCFPADPMLAVSVPAVFLHIHTRAHNHHSVAGDCNQTKAALNEPPSMEMRLIDRNLFTGYF